MLYDLFHGLILDFIIMYHLLLRFCYTIRAKSLLRQYRIQHVKMSVESARLKKARFQSLVDEAIEVVAKFRKDKEDSVVLHQKESLLEKEGRSGLVPSIEKHIKMLDEQIVLLEKEIIGDLGCKIKDLDKNPPFVSPILNPSYHKLMKALFKRRLCTLQAKSYSKLNQKLYCRG